MSGDDAGPKEVQRKLTHRRLDYETIACCRVTLDITEAQVRSPASRRKAAKMPENREFKYDVFLNHNRIQTFRIPTPATDFGSASASQRRPFLE